MLILVFYYALGPFTEWELLDPIVKELFMFYISDYWSPVVEALLEKGSWIDCSNFPAVWASSAS